MILLQDPNMPVPTNAVEIDAAILDIKAHLETGLTWLTNGYGRTYKNLDARNGVTVFYPEAYLGEQNNSHRYINLSPDNDKQGQCFFYVVKETISQFQPGMYSFLSYDTAIIFSVNMELINDVVLQTEIFQQNLVAQVRDVLTRQLMGSSYQLTISSVDFLFENVYSEFDLADAQQLEKAPLSHFRFNCTIQLPEACPVPAIAPPITTCYSMLLDGVNEYISTPLSVGIFDRFDPFTFSMWIKPQFKAFPMIFSKYQSGTGYRCFINSSAANVLQFEMEAAGEISVRTTASITYNQWQLITITHDGSGTAAGIEMYLNGFPFVKNVTSDNLVSSILTVKELQIGAETIQPLYYKGSFASFRAWDVELTSTQVVAEYNSGTILSPAVQGGNLVLNTDINNATFGTQWTIPDLTGTTLGYTSVNMEVEDKVEDCPI
jgi:hypothetical protein